jgi:putative transposase
VAYLVTTYEVSQRRACEVVRAPRSMVRYRHRRPDDAELRGRLKELASERRRFGYRRLNQMLKREGTRVNLKKIRRLYAEERLQVKVRRGRKKATGTRAPMTIPQEPNQRWTSTSYRTSSPIAAGSGFWPWWITSRPNACA